MAGTGLRRIVSKPVAVLAAGTMLATFGSAAQALDETSYQKRGSADFDGTVLRYLRDEAPKIVGGTPAKPVSWTTLTVTDETVYHSRLTLRADRADRGA